jgi:branched-chain amino acid transport system permease protein
VLSQQVLNALVIGSVYALFAVGYTLMFGVLRLLNLAQAASFMLAAMGLWYGVVILRLPLPLGIALGLSTAGAFGIVQALLFTPLIRRGIGAFTLFLMSIGLAQATVALTSFALNPQVKNLPMQVIPATPLPLPGGLILTDLQLATFLAAILLVLALSYLIQRTSFGRSVRTVSEDVWVALLLGIDVNRVVVASIVLSSLLAGVAGIFMALAYNTITPYMGDEVQLVAIAVIVLGGLGSVRGAALGGYLLALAQVLAITYGSSFYRDAIAFFVLFAILLMRPTGLFGQLRVRAD